MKGFFEMILCCAGLHSFRVRKNGGVKERVCMRTGCNHKEKLYKEKDGDGELWNKKRIHSRHSSFTKKVEA